MQLLWAIFYGPWSLWPGPRIPAELRLDSEIIGGFEILSAHLHTQNFCVGFVFDAEQVCQKIFQNSETSNNFGIRPEFSHEGQGDVGWMRQ